MTTNTTTASQPNAAPSVADDCMPELIKILEAVRPNFGDVGTRDVEVRAKRNLIDRAITILKSAAPALPEPAAAQDILEAARAACIAEAVDMNGDYRDACHACAQSIQTLKWDAQPLAKVSAAQAVPEGFVLEGYYRKNGKVFDRLKARPNEHTLASGWVAHYIAQPTDTTREA